MPLTVDQFCLAIIKFNEAKQKLWIINNRNQYCLSSDQYTNEKNIHQIIYLYLYNCK